MIVCVGQQATLFKTKAVMANNEIVDFNLQDKIGKKYLVLMFYPMDFTFVCPTEIISVNNRFGEFQEANADVFLISVDSQFAHLAWKNSNPEQGGIGQIQVPMLADVGGKIMHAYGVATLDDVAYRATFIINQDGIIEHVAVNNLGVGRDIDEVIRLINAIDHVKKHGEVCPSGWTKGKKAMKSNKESTSDYLASNKDKI